MKYYSNAYIIQYPPFFFAASPTGQSRACASVRRYHNGKYSVVAPCSHTFNVILSTALLIISCCSTIVLMLVIVYYRIGGGNGSLR